MWNLQHILLVIVSTGSCLKQHFVLMFKHLKFCYYKIGIDFNADLLSYFVAKWKIWDS